MTSDPRPPLRGEILKYMKKRWEKKADLYSVFPDWSPEYVGRLLRKMEVANLLEEGDYNGKWVMGLKKYRIMPSGGQK